MVKKTICVLSALCMVSSMSISVNADTIVPNDDVYCTNSTVAYSTTATAFTF